MFLESYKLHILENPLLNSKIPLWVEYLKTQKHYRENGMEPDYFFKKRFGICQDDLLTIYKLIDRVKRGKALDKTIKTNIKGNCGISSLMTWSNFDENEDLEGKMNNFELLGQVEDAMNSYNQKMKKNSAKKNWKQNQNDRPWDPTGTVQDEPDRYYTEDLNSSRPNIEFDVQDFAKTNMFNMGKTNMIQQIDNINDILNNNDLITNDFDTEYKRSVPNLTTRKKTQTGNQPANNQGYKGNQPVNNQGGNQGGSYQGGNQGGNQGGYQGGSYQGNSGGYQGGYPGNNQQNMDVGATRFWQDQDILNSNNNTKNTCIPNANPFEHQFDYLDGNYNRVPDPRILGTSSRLDNRATFNK